MPTALGPHRAVLLKNHGVAVVGASIEEAVIGAISLENAAMISMVTEATGTPAADFSDADIATLAANLSRPEQFVINFDYLARKLKGETLTLNWRAAERAEHAVDAGAEVGLRVRLRADAQLAIAELVDAVILLFHVEVEPLRPIERRILIRGSVLGRAFAEVPSWMVKAWAGAAMPMAAKRHKVAGKVRFMIPSPVRDNLIGPKNYGRK